MKNNTIHDKFNSDLGALISESGTKEIQDFLDGTLNNFFYRVERIIEENSLTLGRREMKNAVRNLLGQKAA